MATTTYEAGQSDIRPWGRWRVIEAQDAYVLKRIDVDPGQRLSLQYHRHRSEHWIVVSGSGLATVGDETWRVKAGDHVYIDSGTIHRVESDPNGALTFIEVQSGDLLDEDDIVRIEDDYSRS